MPMNKKTTSSQSPNQRNTVNNDQKPCVSEKTLAFLRSFASNYCVENKLPQGIQGIILG